MDVWGSRLGILEVAIFFVHGVTWVSLPVLLNERGSVDPFRKGPTTLANARADLELWTSHEANQMLLHWNDRLVRFSTEHFHARKWCAGNCSNQRVHEEAATRRVIEHLTPATCFVDVGAHLGWFSCIAAMVAPIVHTFEANPSLMPLLLRNVELNHLQQRIELRHAALSDEAGSVNFAGADLRPGQTFGEGSAQVPALRLDDFLLEKQVAPTILKIDVEGSEFKVLKGALNTLGSHRPRLLLEIHPAKLRALGSSAAEVQELLSKYGYRLQEIGKSGNNAIVWGAA